MFRCLQKLRYPAAYVPSILVEERLEDGSIIERHESSVRDLPGPENFKLKNLLRAGVPIKEVNGLVFDSGSVDLSALHSSKPTEPDEPAPITTSTTTTTEIKE